MFFSVTLNIDHLRDNVWTCNTRPCVSFILESACFVLIRLLTVVVGDWIKSFSVLGTMSGPCKEEQMQSLLAPPEDPYLVGLAHETHVAFMETQPGP